MALFFQHIPHIIMLHPHPQPTPSYPAHINQVNLLFGETKEQLEEKTEVLEETELKLHCVTATLDTTKKVCVWGVCVGGCVWV